MASKESPKGNLPDPNLTEKLDSAFGPDDFGAFAAADQAKAYAEGRQAGRTELLKELNRPLIHAKMIEVARKVTAVGKDSFNEQQKYNFRGIDAVTNALHPVMSEVGVFAAPDLMQANYRDAMTTTNKPTREVTVQVRYTFYAEDGSHIAVIVPGESLDQSDKGAAKAMSVAFRIALLQVFSLPTSEPDPDASYHTRDGVGAMSENVARVLRHQVVTASIPELEPLWAIVLEHSAAERLVAGDSTTKITWADYFAQRVVEIIDQIQTREVGLARYEELKVSPVRHLRYHGELVTTMMTNRAAFIKERAAMAFDLHVTAVTNAASLEELDSAHGGLNESHDAYVITTEQKIELLGLVNDKRAKLEREQHQEAPGSEPSGGEA